MYYIIENHIPYSHKEKAWNQRINVTFTLLEKRNIIKFYTLEQILLLLFYKSRVLLNNYLTITINQAKAALITKWFVDHLTSWAFCIFIDVLIKLNPIPIITAMQTQICLHHHLTIMMFITIQGRRILVGSLLRLELLRAMVMEPPSMTPSLFARQHVLMNIYVLLFLYIYTEISDLYPLHLGCNPRFII